MKVFMTSSIGGARKENGKRLPAPLFWYNGFLEKLQSEWVNHAKVMIIAASPDDHEKNDEVCECLKQSFPLSGLSVSQMEICDHRNIHLANKIGEMDVILLAGGHVPTQNVFFAEIGLKEKLADFDGLLIAWSAGSIPNQRRNDRNDLSAWQVNQPYDALIIYKEYTFTYKMRLSDASVFSYNMHMQHCCMCIFS